MTPKVLLTPLLCWINIKFKMRCPRACVNQHIWYRWSMSTYRPSYPRSRYHECRIQYRIGVAVSKFEVMPVVAGPKIDDFRMVF